MARRNPHRLLFPTRQRCRALSILVLLTLLGLAGEGQSTVIFDGYDVIPSRIFAGTTSASLANGAPPLAVESQSALRSAFARLDAQLVETGGALESISGQSTTGASCLEGDFGDCGLAASRAETFVSFSILDTPQAFEFSVDYTELARSPDCDRPFVDCGFNGQIHIRTADGSGFFINWEESQGDVVGRVGTLPPGSYFLYSLLATDVSGGSSSSPVASLDASASTSFVLTFVDAAARWIDELGGLFSDGTNWQDGTAPGVSDDVIFDRPANYTVEFTSPTETAGLEVADGGVTFQGNRYVAGAFAVGNEAGASGSLTLFDHALETSTSTIGGATGSAGTLVVGSGARWTVTGDVDVGGGGSGEVRVENSGAASIFGTLRVGSTAMGATGQLVLRGPSPSGDTLDLTGDLVVAGGAPGSASVVALDGAVVRAFGDLRLGDGAMASHGEVEIRGIGTFWNQIGDVVLGGPGAETALMVVADGALFEVEGGVGVNGSILSQLALSGEGTEMGVGGALDVGTQAVGTVTVDGGSRLVLAGNTLPALHVGSDVAGARGQVLIQGAPIDGSPTAEVRGEVVVGGGDWDTTRIDVTNGGIFDLVGGTRIGTGDPGTSGRVTVSGTGSSWTQTGDLVVGNGFGQDAAFEVADGGMAEIIGDVRVSASGVGLLSVSGPGSVLLAEGDLEISGGLSAASVTNGGFLEVGVAGSQAAELRVGGEGLASVVLEGADPSPAGDPSLRVHGDLVVGGASTTAGITLKAGGTAEILGNARFGTDLAGPSGSLRVEGDGASFLVDGDFDLGSSGAESDLEILAGGRARVGGNARLAPGGGGSQFANLQVQGAGSELVVDGRLVLADSGGITGLVVEQAGRLQVGQGRPGDALQVTGLSFLSLTGASTVGGASDSLFLNGDLLVGGGEPVVSAVAIRDGGRATIQGNAGIGALGAGAEGALMVEGPSSALQLSGRLEVGGHSTFEVVGGGFTSVAGAATFSQAAATSSSLGQSARITGPGSRLEIAGDVEITNAGDFSFVQIGDGASAVFGTDFAGNQLRIGGGARGYISGLELSAAGVEDSLTLNGDLLLGAASPFEASLSVTNAGRISVSGNSRIAGNGLGGHGLVRIADAGSRWIQFGDLEVGSVGAVSADFEVIDGAEVSVVGATRVGASQEGRLRVSGTGSVFSAVFDDVNVGLQGTGVLEVSNGGRLVADRVVVGATGALVGNGGVIQAPVVSVQGVVAPGSSPGRMTIDGNLQLDPNSTLEIEIGGLLAVSLFDVLEVTGEITGADQARLELAFIDGFAPRAGDVFDFLISDGTASPLIFGGVDVLGLAPGWDFSLDWSAGRLQLTSLVDATPVPEPGTALLLFVGLALLGRRAGKLQKLQEAAAVVGHSAHGHLGRVTR